MVNLRHIRGVAVLSQAAAKELDAIADQFEELDRTINAFFARPDISNGVLIEFERQTACECDGRQTAAAIRKLIADAVIAEKVAAP